MTISARLKEERQRLGLSQPALASIAGSSKSAVISWEKGASAPTAPALAEMAGAGLDPLYILTGRRTFGHPDDLAPAVRDQLAIIRRDILDPASQRLAGETEEQAERRLLEWHADKLSSILRDDAQLLPHDLKDEVAHLLDIATNPAGLSLFRAGEQVEARTRRKRMRDQVAAYLDMNDRHPSEAAISLMVTLAVDHGAPIGPLVELAVELLPHDDGAIK